MKIYLAHSTKYDYQTELYKPIKESSLNQKHKFIFFMDEISKGGVKSSKETIRNSDMLIAEISKKSTGVGIELGWADIFQIPIICIYKKGSKPSKHLKILTKDFIEYTNSKDLIENLKKLL